MHSSVSLGLLLIPYSVLGFFCLFSPVTEFFIFDWVFVVFSSSLLKFSLCSSMLSPNSVNIFITNALNSLSGILFLFH